MCGEKTNFCPNEKEETETVRKNENCSEESSNKSQRKYKATTKDPSVKSKNSKNLEDIPRTPRISCSNYIKTPKTQVSPVKNVKLRSCTKRRTVVFKKSPLTICRKQNSPAQKHGTKSSLSKRNSSMRRQNVISIGSSTGDKSNGKGDYISPSRVIRKNFSSAPLQATSFEEFCKTNRQNYSPCVKQFDLISSPSPFSPGENSLCYSEPDTTSVFAALSTSKPFFSKGKTYSCGILTMIDAWESSFSGEKRSIKEELNETLKQDSDYSDTFYSSENSDVFEDPKSCYVENGSSQDKSADEPTSMLKVQKPVRVEYIDEATMLTKELIMYSNEFLERICEEKGGILSKREIFEYITKESMEYGGDKLRIITDSEEFLRDLKNAKEPQPHTKSSKLTECQSSPVLNNNVPRPPIHSTPCWIRWWCNTEDKVGMNKWKVPDIKINSSSTNDCLSTMNKKGQSVDSTHCIDPITKHDGQNELCTKSRTSLKRVNCEGLISSKFKLYFQYYSKLGGRLKSGAVISRMNSHFWLKKCGVISDETTFKIANDCFSAVAKSKIVLNISDYMQYLILIARTSRILILDVIQKLMSMSIDSTSIHDELEKKSRHVMRPIQSEQNENK